MNELNSDITVEYPALPEYYSDDLQLDIQVTESPELLIESDQLDSEDLQDYLVIQSDPVDYSDQLVLIHEDLQQLDQSIRSCEYILSALLFMLLFWFCYNRIKNAVRLFTGGRNNGYK